MQRWMKAAIAAAALAATTGLAQAGDRYGSRGHDSRGHDSRGHDYRGHDYRGHDYRGRDYYYRGDRDYRSRNWRGQESWHPVPYSYPRYGWRAPGYHRWSRGAYLPRVYFGPSYIVRDYGYYGLRPPPLGYGWVRVDNDFLLAALATGFVADVLFGGY